MMNQQNNTQGNTGSFIPGGNNNKQQQQAQKEPKYLEVEKIEFDGLLKSKITTSVKIAQLISGMFKGAISDFEGTILLPNPQGGFDVTLFFKESKVPAESNQIQAIRHIGAGMNNSGASPMARLNTFNQKTSNKSYELTEDIKDILSEFIYVRGNQRLDWRNHVAEQTENMNYNGGYSIYVTVGGLDIIRLIRKIYGGKRDGARLDYNISLLKPVGVAVSGFNQNFLVNIQQLDNKEVEKLALEAGLVGTVNTLPIIR